MTGRGGACAAAAVRRWVVVKRGAEGVAAIAPDGRMITVPARPVEVRDTTGAGDSFNAGVVYALSLGASWSEALAFAIRVATAVVARPSEDRYPSLADLS